MYLLLLLLSGVLAAHHPELRGEDPDQADIDNGQCIPIKCSLGKPPAHCTLLCSQRQYQSVCHKPGDYCLCHRLGADSEELVSPDEVLDQPDPENSSLHRIYTIFIIPIKNFLHDSWEATRYPPTAGPISVNVHEGSRLFWDFRYILTGLFLLMVGLVVYELIMCRVQSYSKSDPELQQPPPYNEKVFSV